MVDQIKDQFEMKTVCNAKLIALDGSPDLPITRGKGGNWSPTLFTGPRVFPKAQQVFPSAKVGLDHSYNA